MNTTEDALEFLVAGCRAVQVGTSVYTDPDGPGIMVDEMEQRLRQWGASSIEEVIGSIEVDEEWLIGPSAGDG